MNGQMDAQRYHGKKAGHLVLGLLFGPWAIIGTAIVANPTPYNAENNNTVGLSQNKDQFNDALYLMCYKREAKKTLIGREFAGFSVQLAGVLVAGFALSGFHD